MSNLLKKDNKWAWTSEQQAAFEELKEKLTQAPVLACPDFAERFTLQTDASAYGLGAVLTQQISGEERVIAYASRRLLKAEENYSATEKECLAIVWAIRKLQFNLEGYHFDVITDHLALKWLNSINSPTGRIARWALELQQFRFDVHYRRGSQNIEADALSRQPVEALQRTQEEPPKCSWIQRLLKRIQTQPEQCSEFIVENGQIYRRPGNRPDEEDSHQWKLCVARDHRQRVLQECHDHPTAGHQGIRKTINRVTQRYY
ncbi:uncharacterized protein DMAD_00084 [Drosophila madeirensis]|uniref:RNA-directed DNA polymerase n=1 Tax=Drosophila madeirensis TaxID=30013 RepID=A0AAU9FWN7_DROMD